MATTTKQYQLIQKLAANEYLLLHPETDAEVVKVAATGITATDVKGALEELAQLINDITGGGVVTGVKGDSETTYRMGQVNITKANIGLGNVDNTSDANKPISTATQTALDKKEDKANLKALAYKDSLSKSDVGLGNVTNDAQVKRTEMGAANGVATLDTTGKIPTAQLPSYVDDVIEYMSRNAFPTTGETGKIYVAIDTNLTYRWGGTGYVEISPSLALGETSSTAYAGDKGKQNATDIANLKTSVNTLETNYTNLNTKVNGMYTNDQIDDMVEGLETAVGTAQSTADTAKTNAATAQTAAENVGIELDNVKNGTTAIGKANQLTNARNFSISGDGTASAVSFNGTQNVELKLTLATTGVTAGSYSAVTVDSKGRVTAGGQLIEVGTSGQTAPSSNLAVGGLFFKEV